MEKIPSPEEISRLFQEFHTPPHVAEHCGMVERVAVFLAKKMTARGISIDIPLVKTAAVLHDVVRIVDFRIFEPEKFPFPPSSEDIAFWKKLREQYRGIHHAIAGAEILKEKGYQEVANIVLKHRFLQVEEGFDNWEEKIVYYADKRVKFDQVVSLRERLEDGRKRNAPETEGTPEAKNLDEKVFRLEKEICGAANISPEDVYSLTAK